MWYPRIASGVASAVAATLLYQLWLNGESIIGQTITYAKTWELDEPAALLGVMTVISLLVIVFSVGIGGVVTSFGIKASTDGGYEFRSNWLGRWLNNRPQFKEGFCELSARCMARLMLGTFVTISVIGGIAIICYGLYAAPLALASVLVVAVLFVIFIGHTSSNDPVVTKKTRYPLMGICVIVGGWALYGLSLVNWSFIWAKMSNSRLSTSDLTMLTAIGCIMGIVLAILAGIALLKATPLYAKVCPRPANT